MYCFFVVNSVYKHIHFLKTDGISGRQVIPTQKKSASIKREPYFSCRVRHLQQFGN